MMGLLKETGGDKSSLKGLAAVHRVVLLLNLIPLILAEFQGGSVYTISTLFG